MSTCSYFVNSTVYIFSKYLEIDHICKLHCNNLSVPVLMYLIIFCIIVTNHNFAFVCSLATVKLKWLYDFFLHNYFF